MESTNKHTLLIVEDNAINREMLGDILEADYDLFYAENGKVGLDILKKDPSAVSLVLLDLHMPVMGGLEMLPTRETAHFGYLLSLFARKHNSLLLLLLALALAGFLS